MVQGKGGFFFTITSEVFFGTGFFDLRGGEVFFGLQNFSRASRAKPLEKLVRGGFLDPWGILGYFGTSVT